MREDIKKKFLDIMFEPDEVSRHEKVIANAPLQDISVKSKVNNNESLYKKPQEQIKKSVFVDADEHKKVDIKVEEVQVKENNDNKDYEYAQNISPIFGVIESEKKDNEPKVMIDDLQTSKPSSSYLGTVLSPIYGYDAGKSVDAFERYQSEMNTPINDDNGIDDIEDINNEIDDNPYASLHDYDSNNIDDLNEIDNQNDVNMSNDDQLFQELSISDIFKTEEEIKVENYNNQYNSSNNQENNTSESKVTYSSLFENNEDK